MNSRELLIPTASGHSLSATRFAPASPNKISLVISSATGVLQGYYRKFARYFSTLGYTAYTFDYWGIGKSGGRPEHLKKNLYDLKQWGSNDQAAVVAFAKDANPDYQLILLTHSIGGQVIGFNPNYKLIDKIVMVASQSGYWKYFKGIQLPKMLLFWYGMIPLITPLYGYFPARKLGLFENLPKNMAYEWMRWGKKSAYMMHYHKGGQYFFDQITAPILSLSFPKDEFAPKEAVDWLTDQFSLSHTERLHYVPEKAKLNRLRHFGFFKEEFKDELWQLTHQWISNE